jgi:LmbE family N-acetylglucosaminyl deacetylase
VVSFHAHPDDEALLVGGTLARATAEGNRVVIVFATDGAAGLSEQHSNLAALRRREARCAASALGAQRVEFLGYADSGEETGTDTGTTGSATITHLDRARRRTFAAADPDEAARRLEAILRAEHADVLTTYDARGGYGHPDHLQVHRVGALAARRANTPVVLEATIDRRLLWRIGRVVAKLPGIPADFAAARLRDGYTRPEDLTHAVDVRAYSGAKRAAMAAHRSQSGGGAGPRTLAVFLRLPPGLFRMLFGREWFVEAGRKPGPPLCDDIFASLRPPVSAISPVGMVR